MLKVAIFCQAEEKVEGEGMTPEEQDGAKWPWNLRSHGALRFHGR